MIFIFLIFSQCLSEIIQSRHRIGDTYQITLDHWSTVTISLLDESTILCHVVKLQNIPTILFQASRNRFEIENDFENENLSKLNLHNISEGDEGES